MPCAFEGRGKLVMVSMRLRFKRIGRVAIPGDVRRKPAGLSTQGGKITGIPLWLFQACSCVYVFLGFA